MGVVDARRTVAAVWRIEASRLVARLVRLTGNLGRAEDLAQDSLVAALETWPGSGVPDNPGAWLMATAKRRGIDGPRRRKLAKRKREDLAVGTAGRKGDVADPEPVLDDPIGDDVLRLILMACHPRARVAEETDWERIASLYGALAAVAPSPVVELNRAVAVAWANGPAAGLEFIEDCSTNRTSPTTLSSRRRAVICWPGSAAPTRRPPTSAAPPLSRETSASARSSSPAPGR